VVDCKYVLSSSIDLYEDLQQRVEHFPDCQSQSSAVFTDLLPFRFIHWCLMSISFSGILLISEMNDVLWWDVVGCKILSWHPSLLFAGALTASYICFWKSLFTANDRQKFFLNLTKQNGHHQYSYLNTKCPYESSSEEMTSYIVHWHQVQ